MRRLIVFLILLLLLAPCALAQRFDAVAIDALRTAGQFAEAREQLLAVPEAEQTVEVLWRKARAEYDLGRVARGAEPRQTHFEKAMTVAEQAIAADPQHAGGYKWLAISQGTLAQESSTRRKIELSRGVRENIRQALDIDPRDDFSLLVLGKWNYSVATLGFLSRTVVKVVYGGLPDASLIEAERLLRQALEIRARAIHHYTLARVLEASGHRREAIAELEKAILLEPTYPHEQEDIAAARTLLVELTN